MLCSFIVKKHVEGITEKSEKVICGAEPANHFAIVVSQRIRDNKVSMAVDCLPERQFVTVVIAVVKETRRAQPADAGYWFGTVSAIPAERTLACCFLMKRRLSYVLALLLFTQLEVLDQRQPWLQTSASDPGLRWRFRGFSFQRKCAGEHREREVSLLKEAKQPPKPTRLPYSNILPHLRDRVH